MTQHPKETDQRRVMEERLQPVLIGIQRPGLPNKQIFYINSKINKQDLSLISGQSGIQTSSRQPVPEMYSILNRQIGRYSFNTQDQIPH